MQLTRKQRDKMQIVAFRAVYKVLRGEERDLDEAFVLAIAATCDEEFIKAKSNPLIEEWFLKYGQVQNLETDNALILSEK